jgi:hypothetical protein
MITATRPRSKASLAADRIINAGRRRFLRLRVDAQPGQQPHNLLGLFGPVELLHLALARRWPLSDVDRAWVTGSEHEEGQ